MPIVELPASCEGCGACCYGLQVDVTDDDLTKHGTPHALTVVEEGRRYMQQEPDDHDRCAALDPKTRLCTIYENRPEVCRVFNRGDTEDGNELCFDVVAGLRVEQGRMVVPEPKPLGRLLHLLRMLPTYDLTEHPDDGILALRHLMANAHTRLDTHLTTKLAQRMRDVEIELGRAQHARARDA